MTKHILILIDQPIQILGLRPQRPRQPIAGLGVVRRRIGIIPVVGLVDDAAAAVETVACSCTCGCGWVGLDEGGGCWEEGEGGLEGGGAQEEGYEF
jgi:hypothetical protein